MRAGLLALTLLVASCGNQEFGCAKGEISLGAGGLFTDFNGEGVGILCSDDGSHREEINKIIDFLETTD